MLALVLVLCLWQWLPLLHTGKAMSFLAVWGVTVQGTP